MAEDPGLELRPLVDLGFAVRRQEQTDVGMTRREAERQVPRRRPAPPAGFARVDHEERIAAVEHDVERVGGNTIDDFVFEERRVRSARPRDRGSQRRPRRRRDQRRRSRARCAFRPSRVEDRGPCFGESGQQLGASRRLRRGHQLGVQGSRGPVEPGQQPDVVGGRHPAKQLVVPSAIVVGVLQIGTVEPGAPVVRHDDGEHRRRGGLRTCRGGPEAALACRRGGDRTLTASAPANQRAVPSGRSWVRFPARQPFPRDNAGKQPRHVRRPSLPRRRFPRRASTSLTVSGLAAISVTNRNGPACGASGCTTSFSRRSRAPAGIGTERGFVRASR